MSSRIERAQSLAAERGVDALLITPGANLRYLSGYEAKPLERLTCLVVPAEGEPTLVVPLLERAAAESAEVSMPIATWTETEDPFGLVGRLLGTATRIALDDEMWAARVFALQSALPGRELSLAGQIVSDLRIHKDADEIAALREAGAAIDSVHAAMAQWLRPGRTERDVGADIARAILDAGHTSVDFVIVGSGPNGASPHHEVSDRVIGVGDPVVVDIGGTTAAGYCSDSTRTYVAGGEPPREFSDFYAVLQRAQQVQREQARPGITAESLDRVGRDIIAAAGYGDQFIHRTGHGIGQQTHEEPYIVAGNSTELSAGMAFSIEPGIYLPGRFGARIEDIVVCTEDGVEVLNNTSREVVVLPG